MCHGLAGLGWELARQAAGLVRKEDPANKRPVARAPVIYLQVILRGRG
jgi:hypothetical protein